MADKWGFIGPCNPTQSSTIDGELLENWYLEKSQSPFARSPYAMYPTPGLTPFASGMESPMRGSFEQDGRTFFVGGGHLYELMADTTIADRGAVASDPMPATFASNGTYLVITSGGRVYVFTLATNDLSIVADTDCPTNALMVVYLGGYFILLTVAGQIIYSVLNTPTSWVATDLIIKSNTSDLVKAIIVQSQQLWLIGSKFIEVWVNTGNALTPFQPVPGVVIEQGTPAPFSVAKVAGTFCFLGQHSSGSAIVYRAQGYNVVPVSTFAISYQIGQIANVGPAVAWSYQDHGHDHYLLNFGSVTWALDVTMGEFGWHRRSYLNPQTGRSEAHLGSCHAYAFGKHLVGSRRDGVVYEMSSSIHSDAGDAIRRVRRTAPVGDARRRTFYTSLAIEAEVGVGLSSGQGSTPQMMLRWSDNAGKTFGNEHWRSAGAQGAYSTLVEWQRMGSSTKPRVFELVCSDPVPWRIAEADLDWHLGAGKRAA